MIRSKLIIAFLILVFPELGWAQAREKLRVALGSVTVNSSVIPIGKEAGIFANCGTSQIIDAGGPGHAWCQRILVGRSRMK